MCKDLAYSLAKWIVLDLGDPGHQVLHRHIASLVGVQAHKSLVNAFDLWVREIGLRAKLQDL